MLRIVVLVLGLTAFLGGAAARDTKPNDAVREHVHSTDKGSHGGSLQDLAAYEAELVIQGRTIVLYLTDPATGTPVRTEGLKATIFVVRGSNRRGTIILKSQENAFRANAHIPRGADAVVNLFLSNGESRQARFEVGEHRH